MSAWFESLENRQHFSAASIVLRGSVLTMTGTAAAEIIDVASINSKTLDVSISSFKGTLVHKIFNTSAVKQINIIAGAGDDQIFANSLSPRVKISIDAGAGDDQIQGSLYGSDTITGGAGRDIIIGGMGKDVIYTRGDGAHDSISVASGSKVYRDSTDTLSLV